MRKAFLAAGYDETQTQDALTKMNFNKDGELDYTEFVQSSVDPSTIGSEENMFRVFKQFDVEGSG